MTEQQWSGFGHDRYQDWFQWLPPCLYQPLKHQLYTKHFEWPY
jgi:hypothetical protein